MSESQGLLSTIDYKDIQWSEQIRNTLDGNGIPARGVGHFNTCTAYWWCALYLLGCSGFHRYYLGDNLCCVLFCLTSGWCGVGNIVDCCCTIDSMVNILNNEIDGKLAQKRRERQVTVVQVVTIPGQAGYQQPYAPQGYPPQPQGYLPQQQGFQPQQQGYPPQQQGYPLQQPGYQAYPNPPQEQQKQEMLFPNPPQPQQQPPSQQQYLYGAPPGQGEAPVYPTEALPPQGAGGDNPGDGIIHKDGESSEF